MPSALPFGLLAGLLAALLLAGCAAPGPEAAAPQPTAEPEPEPEPAPEPEPTLSAAEELIAATAAALPRWADVAAAEADGYRSIGDGFTGYEHLVHPVYSLSAVILDPQRPESLVYRVHPDGVRELVSAMFMLPPGSTMDDVPDLGDDRAEWHTHDDLCFDEQGRLAGLHVDGRCVPGGVHVPTPPMLHVWIVDHPCGPFAGLEGHGDACEHGDH